MEAPSEAPAQEVEIAALPQPQEAEIAASPQPDEVVAPEVEIPLGEPASAPASDDAGLSYCIAAPPAAEAAPLAEGGGSEVAAAAEEPPVAPPAPAAVVAPTLEPEAAPAPAATAAAAPAAQENAAPISEKFVEHSPTACREAAAGLPVYCPTDVARHSSQDDAWVSIAGVVFDMTRLLRPGGVKISGDAEQLIAAAGTDVSRWFTRDGASVRTYVDPLTNLVSPYLPSGRIPHVPPTATPITGWAPPNAPPWWRNPDLVVGRLTARARRLRVVNTLTGHEHMLFVGCEQTISDIATKYLEYNAHAAGYTWKVLKPDYDSAILPLDMEKTLEENKVEDETEEIERLGLDTEDDDLIPTVLLYYSDTLTIA